MLEYFMRHTGRVLTRPMISEHVWNQDFDTFTNVIDVYVNYLRNKIDRGRTRKADPYHSWQWIHVEGGLMPLRVRLTLWYGTALALILITFSVVLYTITERSLRDQVDESLQETAEAAVRSLEERGFLPLIDEDELLNQFPELARIDKFFQIFSPSGTITLRSPNIRQHEVPLSRKALEVAFTGRTIFESAKYPNEPPLRLISVPIVYRGSLLYVVQVGTSLEAVDGTLHRFLIVLLVMTPIALGDCPGGGLVFGRAGSPPCGFHYPGRSAHLGRGSDPAAAAPTILG